MTIAAGRPEHAKRAFRAIEAATEVIQSNGFVPPKLPSDIGGPPSKADIASAAAFFLGDACLGIVALNATGKSQQVASTERLQLVMSRLSAAVEWLLTQ